MSASGRFLRRAALYARLDAQLASRTRFFGAACRTNRVLSFMAAHTHQGLLSQDTCDWLAATGALLARSNIAIAAAVARDLPRVTAPDAHLVRFEQTLVERALQAARGSAAYPRLLAQLNSRLNIGCYAAWMRLSPQVYWYSEVLSSVRQQLATPLNFAIQPHREAIGMGLISALRRDEGCA